MFADVFAGVLAGGFMVVVTAISGAVGLASFAALCALLVAAFLRVGTGEQQVAEPEATQEATTRSGRECARPAVSLSHQTAVAGPSPTPAVAGPGARRQRLGVVNSDGERVALYASDQYARGLSMRGLVLLPGFGGQGGKLTDLSTLRETWVIAPRHWMN